MTEQIDRLDRWIAHGGTCQLVQTGTDSADVVLRRCDGGEEVERFATSDPAVLAWVREHQS